MKPIKFKEYNVVFAENQPSYLPLPGFRDVHSDNGEFVTCWQLSFTERLRILFKGCIWMTMLTFNKPITPTYMSTKKSDVIL